MSALNAELSHQPLQPFAATRMPGGRAWRGCNEFVRSRLSDDQDQESGGIARVGGLHRDQHEKACSAARRAPTNASSRGDEGTAADALRRCPWRWSSRLPHLHEPHWGEAGRSSVGGLWWDRCSRKASRSWR